VLEPSAHDYFYFVAKGGGLHAFSHSLEDHNAAVSQHRAPSAQNQTAKAPEDAKEH
jgi:cell division protein YceG involved in septum cleavage